MAAHRISGTVQTMLELARPLFETFQAWQQGVAAAGDEACDFLAGNPQEPAMEGYAETLREWSVPRSRDWFAYKMSEPEARAAAASSLRRRLGVPFEQDDIAMTNAAIAALAVSLRAIAERGDQVILVSPPHFLYEPLIRAAGAGAVRVGVNADDLDLDLGAIASALNSRTKAIIVNTPHNPTGKIFPPETLERLAAILTEASGRWGTIYLLSDEAYNRIVFDDRPFFSPAAFYPNTLLIYSYGKQLLAPGERIGYIALAPTMPDRGTLMEAIVTAQIAGGWSFPNALLQHAVVDLESLSVDMPRLQAKRDHMVSALRGAGYELHVPEATFYLLVRSPLPDDRAFCKQLAREKVFVMPGAMLERPGYFRISLTATEDMIERSLPVFQRAMARASAATMAAGSAQGRG
jgi:aspartate aminotransferase